ncbi:MULTISPECIES: GNAT family N-acetyltransferase [unclassified Chelatococcus]|uniref:GNAT family N-acetyltransferase n=1 Tax=unclassified Chelatococcus TaxID=2638111 RepID=UPI00030C5F46|nr:MULTISPECIES: GNAT family N-acetyltransferase [unclassified Chelatococcus]ALA17391.1 GNAT family acetyltransferase [Chelatococcus sp. CO-6]
MTAHELDRPAWASLTSRHEAFADGDAKARRYRPSIVPFAASADDSPESLEALGTLLEQGDTAILLQAGEIRLPASLRAIRRAEGVQMVADGGHAPFEDERIVKLGPADAEDMLALAALTEPGPFTLRALDIGRFWGVRENGRLVAMAGERMAQPGHVELSGVCTHPEARGRGLGHLLSRYVAGRIAESGDRPYLHAFASNTAAIRLYASIDFTLRTTMQVAVIQHIDD